MYLRVLLLIWLNLEIRRGDSKIYLVKQKVMPSCFDELTIEQESKL